MNPMPSITAPTVDPVSYNGIPQDVMIRRAMPNSMVLIDFICVPPLLIVCLSLSVCVITD